MKTFYRFWFELSPGSRRQRLIVYAADLETATKKASERLERTYAGRGLSLLPRVETFSFEESNSYCATSRNIASEMTAADIGEVAADMDTLNPDECSPTFKRLANEFLAIEFGNQKTANPDKFPKRRKLANKKLYM